MAPIKSSAEQTKICFAKRTNLKSKKKKKAYQSIRPRCAPGTPRCQPATPTPGMSRVESPNRGTETLPFSHANPPRCRHPRAGHSLSTCTPCLEGAGNADALQLSGRWWPGDLRSVLPSTKEPLLKTPVLSTSLSFFCWFCIWFLMTEYTHALTLDCIGDSIQLAQQFCRV
jgi:hypothetical protein